MKKVIGLCVVILMNSVSLFAQAPDKRVRKDRERNEGKRLEKLTQELKLSDQQVAQFEKLNAQQREKMKAEREATRVEREKHREAQKTKRMAMRDERNAEVKKILSSEQYEQYLAKQKAGMEKQKERMSKQREKGDRPRHKGRRG